MADQTDVASDLHGAPSVQPSTLKPPEPRRTPIRKSLDFPIAVIAATGIFLHLIFRFLLPVNSAVAAVPLYVVLIAGGLPLVFGLLKKVLTGDFGSDLLAGLSITT